MPIRVNLLAEALAAEDMRRRDPVKRTLFGGAFVIVLVLVWSSSLLLKTMLAKKDVEQVQAEIDTRTNAYALVTGNLNKIAVARRNLSALEQLSNARFLQGNLLNTLQQVYVPNVQLRRVDVEQSYSVKAATKKSAAENTEQITILLDAKDDSSNPGDNVNKFKDAISTQPFFQTRLAKSDAVRLSNLTAPQSGPDGKPFVLFTIECHLKDQTR